MKTIYTLSFDVWRPIETLHGSKQIYKEKGVKFMVNYCTLHAQEKLMRVVKRQLV